MSENSSPKFKFCPFCAHELAGNPKFCPECGANLAKEGGSDQTAETKTETTPEPAEPTPPAKEEPKVDPEVARYAPPELRPEEPEPAPAPASQPPPLQQAPQAEPQPEPAPQPGPPPMQSQGGMDDCDADERIYIYRMLNLVAAFILIPVIAVAIALPAGIIFTLPVIALFNYASWIKKGKSDPPEWMRAILRPFRSLFKWVAIGGGVLVGLFILLAVAAAIFGGNKPKSADDLVGTWRLTDTQVDIIDKDSGFQSISYSGDSVMKLNKDGSYTETGDSTMTVILKSESDENGNKVLIRSDSTETGTWRYEDGKLFTTPTSSTKNYAKCSVKILDVTVTKWGKAFAPGLTNIERALMEPVAESAQAFYDTIIESEADPATFEIKEYSEDRMKVQVIDPESDSEMRLKMTFERD